MKPWWWSPSGRDEWRLAGINARKAIAAEGKAGRGDGSIVGVSGFAQIDRSHKADECRCGTFQLFGPGSSPCLKQVRVWAATVLCLCLLSLSLIFTQLR